MTVGILGMAFKAESDDIRSSLSYKLKRILRFKARRGAVHRPVRAPSTPTSCRSTRSLERADLLVIGAPHAATATSRPTARRRHLEPARATGSGCDGARPAAVSVVIPVYNEGEAIVPCLDRILDGVTLPCEVLVVFDDDERHDRPAAREVRRSASRGAPLLNTVRPRPGPRHPLRHRPRRRRRSWS